jgi:indolepyruvate ferredoxin oxidoreductase alpha subunit
LLEPTTIPEAKELMRWAYSLSNEYDCHLMVRSYTRLSHASSLIEVGELKQRHVQARTDSTISISPYLAIVKHAAVLERLAKIKDIFESSPYNWYEGPENPELIVISSGSGYLCTRDALESIGVQDAVGILKLSTLWPFPKKFVAAHLTKTDRFLIAEEVDPYVEVHVKEAMADCHQNGKQVYGKESGHIPSYGEITPDRITRALGKILRVDHPSRSGAYTSDLAEQADPLIIARGLAWCPGCPHRATFWALDKAIKQDKRNAYLTGDIGCYTLDVFPGGKFQQNLLHAMGSGSGLASGFGQLGRFGYQQPVVSVCGDSTFFHASIPALINAVTNGSTLIQVVLDNEATAMTGFQSHPGTGTNALGQAAPKIEIETLCRSLGCKVTVADPFDIKSSIRTMRHLLKEDTGVRVLIMQRACELLRMRQEKVKPFTISVDAETCRGEECRICTREFRCPGLVWDPETDKTAIREDICSGCGVCADICPFGAIEREEAVQ